jgi:hypothetical protein
MFPRLLCLLICLPGLTLCGQTQTPATHPTTLLRDQLEGQRFIVRNLSGAEKFHASWDGHTAKFDTPVYRMLATLTINRIQLKGSTVEIEATRTLLLGNKTGKLEFSSFSTPVTLTLTLEGDPAALAPTLRDAIFSPSTQP